MRHLIIFVFASVFCSGEILDAHAQTATVTQTSKQSESYSYGNASGFSIANDGTLIYSGPLNQLNGSPCCIAATLTVDGQSVVVDASTYEADTGLKVNEAGGNTLSSELSTSQIKPQPGSNQFSLQYDVVIGGAQGVGASDSYSIQEKVDAQSLSIFPQFQPSVFP